MAASVPPARSGLRMAGSQDQRLLTLAGCIQGLVLEFDANARYLNAWADDPALLARPREEMLGRTIEEVLGTEVGAPFTAMVRRVLATGMVERIEYPLDVQGGRRWFLADIKRTPGLCGEATAVFFARDITERMEMERALRDGDERYRLASRATNDILWDWDRVRNRVDWGANAAPFFGEQPGTELEWWRDHIHPEDRARVVENLEVLLAGTAEAWSDVYRLRLRDGRCVDCVDRAFIVRDESGVATRIVGSMADVSELNRLRAQLVHADRLASLGTMAAGLGHEINNPLSYVLTNVEVALEMLEEMPPEDRVFEVSQMLREARDGAERIADILKGLKSFTSTRQTKLAEVWLSEVLEEALRITDNELRHHAVVVRELAPTPPVLADASQLGTVFVTLLLSSARSMVDGDREGNEIRVETGVDEAGHVFARISDSGPALDAEAIAQMFDPFLAGSKAELGLSISHDIVRRLGGALTAQSAPTGGKSFLMCLPIAPGAEPPVVTATDPARLAARRQPRGRILVIDDQPTVIRAMARLLRTDAEVVGETSAARALSRIDAGERFDLILCDVMMPDMSGVDFYVELRTRKPELVERICFLTAGVFTPRAREFLASVANPRLDKPIDAHTLRAIVRAAIRTEG